MDPGGNLNKQSWFFKQNKTIEIFDIFEKFRKILKHFEKLDKHVLLCNAVNNLLLNFERGSNSIRGTI